MTDFYYYKYLKYKTKYSELNDNLNGIKQIGGKITKMSKWDLLKKKREKELSTMKSTRSYLNKNNLTYVSKEYYIHDNGGRPFKVAINKENINIYIYDTSNPEIYKKKILSIKNFIGYWYGFDASPSPQHGNSILVKINNKKYIYIGSEIYQFNTKEEIIDYISPIGNSDVPYPVAFGKENVYFMLDRVYIMNNELETPITVAKSPYIYGEFYGHIGSKKGAHKKYNMLNTKILWPL